MGEYMALLGMSFTGIAAVFFALAYKLYKPPPVAHKKDISAEGASETLSDQDSPNGICGTSLPTVDFAGEESTHL